jgi:chromosome partitioning protein
MIVVAVSHLKGGVGKTTTAGYLAAAFHEAGLRTLGADADGENDSLIKWQVDGDLPFAVIGLAVSNLHTQLPGIVGDRYDVVVIDCPPIKERRSVVRSAYRIATHIVVPMAPSPIEYDKLPAVAELIQESAELRPDGRAPASAVLFTRVKPRVASTAVYRQQATEAGWTVLATEIGDREQYRQAWGSPIKNASKTPFGAAAAELLDLEVAV